MSELPQTVTLGPEEEAQRLWQGARDARQKAGDSLAALSESLDLGLRAAEILGVHKLRPIKAEFPATIGLLLDAPSPEVEAYRDAVNVPPTLGFTDLLDLLSEESLECVGPGLHRGWEDRVFSCRRSRKTAQEALGFNLPADQRERLLLLSAYRNRIFRTPPPIRLVSADIEAAFDDLDGLVERLGG
jgi:hypothetical protein